jgi:sugar phosphate permease
MRMSLRQGVLRVVSEPRFWPLALWFFLIGGSLFSFLGLWAGPFLQHVYGMSKGEVGDILSTIALAMIVGSPLMSFASDRIFHSRKNVMILSTLMLVAIVLLLNLIPGGLTRPALYVIVFLFCVSSSAIVVIGFTTTKELFPIEIAGTSVGTVNLFPFLGGALMQIGLGEVLDAYPRTESGGYPVEAYSVLLLLLLVASVVALACTFLIKETFPLSHDRG